MQCRFAGHCKRFYSIAEHSVHLSRYFEDRHLALWALFHDATEAYLTDVPRPIKPYLSNFVTIEDYLMQAIATRFYLPGATVPEQVKNADASIIHDERMFVMAMTDDEWEQISNFEPLGIFIECWSPIEAKAEFYQRYLELTS
jgi:uncharacterized protein